MHYIDNPFWACKHLLTEYCPKCKVDSFVHYTNKYAIEKWCMTCGYFTYTWFECCENQDINKVIYYMKDNRPSVREQCLNCGKLIPSKAIGFKTVNQEELHYFNESHEANRNEEILFLKKDYKEKKKFNFTIRYYKGYLEYLRSDKWKEIRLKILKRDNNLCQKCKSEKAYHVHHLTYKNLFHEKLEDLISICIKCHTIEHPNINDLQY